MTHYAKLINGVINFAPNKIKKGDSITYNPTAETLTELGYIPVKFTEEPKTEPGFVAVCTWKEIDGTILQIWHIEETEPSAEELLNILTGETES